MSGAWPLHLLREAEDALVRGLDLTPLPLGPSLARAEGSWKGAPALLSARAYHHGPVRYARFVELTAGHLEIGNLLCLSRTVLPLPILGADLVALGGGEVMIAADLSPVLAPGPARDAQLAGLAARRAQGTAPPPGGALPDWCARWFSPHALYTRAGEGDAAAAATAFRTFAPAFLELCAERSAQPGSAAATQAAQAAYARAHREDDKGLGMLARMFGADWAARFVGEVLFPDP